MSQDISIIGAGGFGREVKHLIDEINVGKKTWNILGFYDSNIVKGSMINGVAVLGGDEDVLESDCENFVLAIGNPHLIKRISAKLNVPNKNFPNLVHPQASLGDVEYNDIGYGNIFTYGFYVTSNVKIGNFNIFNTRVTVGHDVDIGSFNVFLPNVQLSGNVSVGDGNLFGMNSSVLEKRKIGSGNKIGAHSFVATNLGSDKNVFGCPAVNL